MGRELKRVPLDFDYPIDELWAGYLIKPSFCSDHISCELCKHYAKLKGIDIAKHSCPDFVTHYRTKDDFDPPKGDGYQLWNTTTEGHPMSPVFKTLEELSAWCETNATTFADCTASKEKWYEMLSKSLVYHTP
jgi:hypothetical protein